MNNKKEQSQQAQNDLLKFIFTTKSYCQIIFILIEFIVLTTVFYFLGNNFIESLDIIININLAIFGTNLTLFIFIIPFLIKDKTKYLEYQHTIYKLKTLKKVKNIHLEDLKKIDARIFLDSKVLNFLYLNTLLLITTFCSTLFVFIFVNNKAFILAINSGHIIVEISYILSSILILGPCIRTNDLTKMYTDMLAKENDLLAKNNQITCILPVKMHKIKKSKISNT